MSLDTLLKAAQYIELQEQSRSLELSPIPSIGERFHRTQPQQQQHFYDSVSNSRNNARHQQVSSSPSSSSSSPSSSSSSSSPPATAYVLSNGQIIHNSNNLSSSINNNNRHNNNNNNNISQLIHNDFDYGVEAVTNAVAATAVNGRSSEGRSITEEPYSNGHSSPSSFVMIKTPTPSTTITTNKHQQQQLHQQGIQSQEQQSLSSSINNNNCSPKNDMISSLFSNNNNNNTTITVVDKNKNSILTTNQGSASKNAINTSLSAFNGGVNLAALSAAAAAATTQPIVINVTNTRTAANTLLSANNNNNNNLLIHPHTTIPATTTIGNANSLRNSPPMVGTQTATPAANLNNSSSSSVFRKKCIPLTPPPMSNRKFIESSRIRSHSLSSNKIITANGLVGSNGFVTSNNINNNNTGSSTTNININNTSSSNTPAILHNHHIHQVLAAAAEDSSQSSLNLSSSGYLSGSSINSNVGSINLSTTLSGGSGVPMNGVSMMNGSPPRGGSLLVSGVGSGHLEHPMSCVASSAPTSSGVVHQLHGSIGGGSRRRTISSNSNGAGTREVHNKLEKHRRAQLKECFEQLKNQLQLKDEERKKTSNLSILGAALKHVMALKIKEQELEQQVELLAKEKINAQKKIVTLKRELGSKVDNIDFSSIISDIELGSIPIERVTEGLNDSISLSSGRGSMLYSSSSSLSSGSGGNTMSSPLGAGMQTSMPTALSPVISQQQQQQQQQSTTSSFSASSSNSSPISPNIMMKSSLSSPLSQSHCQSTTAIPMVTNLSNTGGCSSTAATSITMPLSLTAKNISATSMTRGSPTPSTPSPSPSSSSGVSSSSSIHSSSPPIVGVKVVPNIPTTSCVKFGVATTTNGNTFVSSPVINVTHSENNGGISSSNSVYASGMPLNMNAAILASSSSSSTTFPSFFSSTSASPSTSTTTTATSHGKESNGRNGLTRKTPSSGDGHNNNIDSYFNNNNNQHHYQQQQILDEGEQPAKVFKVFNGLALGQMDKDSKLSLAGAPLQLSQVVGGGSLVVSPFMTSSQNGGSLRLVGPNSLATIELSSGPSSQSSSSGRCTNGNLLGQSLSPPNSGGAQLHKLLMSAVSASAGAGGGSTSNTISNGNSSSFVSAAAEVGRLPGGAELNILPTATNGTLYRGNGKLSIVNNNGISLKGADTNSSNNVGRSGVHVLNTQVLQSAAGLASIGVPQTQQNNNFAQLIAASPQMTGKVNLSVGGQGLPFMSGTQYLGSVKPVVMAVSSSSTTNNNNNNNNNNCNSIQPTLPSLSSVVIPPPTSLTTTSTAIVTGTTNGNAL